MKMWEIQLINPSIAEAAMITEEEVDRLDALLIDVDEVVKNAQVVYIVNRGDVTILRGSVCPGCLKEIFESLLRDELRTATHMHAGERPNEDTKVH